MQPTSSNFNRYFEITPEKSIVIKSGLDASSAAKARSILRTALDNYGPNSKNYVHKMDAPKTFARSSGTFTEDIEIYIGGDRPGEALTSVYPVGVNATNPLATTLINKVQKYINSLSP